jgi:tRNA(fMet)-specific endonuclease VapC
MGGASSAASQSYLIDSSILIPSLRGDSAITARIASVPAGYVSSIVLGELYFGAYGSQTRQAAALQDITDIMQRLAVLVPDATTAQVYGRIKQELKGKGLFMPDNDLWIAATAMQYGITLAARDAHFDWIDGLSVEQW